MHIGVARQIHSIAPPPPPSLLAVVKISLSEVILCQLSMK